MKILIETLRIFAIMTILTIGIFQIVTAFAIRSPNYSSIDG